jgi:hypothetical protein
MVTTYQGESEAARLLATARNRIFDRCNDSVTLSKQEAIEAVSEAWQSANEDRQRDPHATLVAEEVRDCAIQFIRSLPLGFPQPEVISEPDGHVNLEWYRSTRRVFSVSIGPNNRLYWAALIGTESPRGTVRFLERIPTIILDQIARVFEG